MTPVQTCELPPLALLHRYREAGAYADCYMAEIAGSHTQAAFVEAFYTTALFKLERVILARLAGRPSTDAQARQLGEGSSESFAAWRVEARAANQLLLGDFTGRTKSWLMSAQAGDTADGETTRLYFGSAVVPRTDKKTGERTMGFAFNALLSFHRLYSRLLLQSARSRLLAAQRGNSE